MIKEFPSYLEINLTNLGKNYNYLNGISQKNTKTGAVVKTDAYGLGAVRVSKYLQSLGCQDFFVSATGEALELREEIHGANIYIFTGATKEDIAEIGYYGFIPVINSPEQLDIVANYKKPLEICLKFNTGMNRLGFRESEVEEVKKKLADSEHLKVKYIMSHLGSSEEADDPRNKLQLDRFNEILKSFPGIPASLSNSSGILLGSKYRYNLTRPGAYLYGICMTEAEVNQQETVVSKYAEVVHKYIADRHDQVSYSNTHEIEPGTKVLVVRIGYADGYMRQNGNHAYMYSTPHRLPVIGNVTMDMTMLDASKMTEKQFSECNFVEVFGNNVNISEVAAVNNTIGYEILTSVGRRFAKKYIL